MSREHNHSDKPISKSETRQAAREEQNQKFEDWTHSTRYEWTVVTLPALEEEERRRRSDCNISVESIDFVYNIEDFQMFDLCGTTPCEEDCSTPRCENDRFIMRNGIPIPYSDLNVAKEKLTAGADLEFRVSGGTIAVYLDNGTEVGEFPAELLAVLRNITGATENLYGTVIAIEYDDSIPYFTADIWEGAT